MELNNVEIRVLVKGKPITEYAHNGNLFIEGREGSEFEIELVNRNPFRVEAILTVDGLSVLDGKEGSLDSSGYLLEANSTVRQGAVLHVPGWKLDNEQAAKFVFSGKSGSYATQMSGSSRNNGVIGCMVFAERYKRPVTKTRTPPAQPYTVDPARMWFNGQPLSGGYVNMTSAGTPPFPLNINCVSTVSTSKSMDWGNDVSQSFAASASTMDWYDNEPERGSTRSITKGLSKGITPQASLNNLGTGFGASTIFETETVTFDRGDLLGMLVLYYDNATGLRQRGIQVGRPRRVKHTAQTPQAFPGLHKGCPVPRGWKG